MDNNKQNDQEIDLIYLFKKLKELIYNLGLQIFKIIRFFIKNKFITLGLIIFGILLGFFIENNTKKTFKNELIVIPNFGSTEYLYQKINNFHNIQINHGDEKKYLENIISIEIVPVIDNDVVIEHAENKIKDEHTDDIFKKTTRQFLITIHTRDSKLSKKSIDIFLSIINNSKYFEDKKNIEIQSLKNKKIQLNRSINQINNILDDLESNKLIDRKSHLNVNFYSGLSDIISLKNKYLNTIDSIDSKLLVSDKIIYPINKTYNNLVIENPYNHYHLKILLPVLFIATFLIIHILKNIYRHYQNLNQNKNR